MFDRARRALNGLPTCAFCHRDFTRWEGLSAHTANRRCERLPDSLAFEPLAVAAGEAALDNSLSKTEAAAAASAGATPSSATAPGPVVHDWLSLRPRMRFISWQKMSCDTYNQGARLNC